MAGVRMAPTIMAGVRKKLGHLVDMKAPAPLAPGLALADEDHEHGQPTDGDEWDPDPDQAPHAPGARHAADEPDDEETNQARQPGTHATTM